jgi:hypothetical protein
MRDLVEGVIRPLILGVSFAGIANMHTKEDHNKVLDPINLNRLTYISLNVSLPPFFQVPIGDPEITLTCNLN